MKKILFVCHGNICRSTTAQWVFEDLVGKASLENRYEIDSAALTGEEIGNPIYPPMARVLDAHHIPYGDHRARRMTLSDAKHFDHIYYMDGENRWHLERLLSGCSELLSKCEPLSKNKEISDPWYTRNFEKAYAQILAACKERLEEIEHE